MVRGRRGHTVLAEPGGHTACVYFVSTALITKADMSQEHFSHFFPDHFQITQLVQVFQFSQVRGHPVTFPP